MLRKSDPKDLDSNIKEQEESLEYDDFGPYHRKSVQSLTPEINIQPRPSFKNIEVPKKNEEEDNKEEESGLLEYKEFNSKFNKIELAGFKGEDKILQLQEKATNKIFQLMEKKIKVNKFDEEMKRYHKLYHVRHENILKLCFYTYQFMQETHGSPYCKISLLFEDAETDMFKLLNERRKKKEYLDNINMLSLIRLCIAGMCHLQEKGITHENLTLKNIFITRENQIKILPNYFDKPIAPHASVLYKSGIPSDMYYFSPEVFKQKNWRVPYEKPKIDPYKSDMFTLGLNLLEVATFTNCSKCYNLYEVDTDKLREITEILKNRYNSVINLIFSQMLSPNDALRQNFKDLHTNISNMTIDDIRITLFTKVEESISIDKLNNPDYLPQDFVNEIELKLQIYQKKNSRKFVEIFYTDGNKYHGEVNSEKQPQGFGSLWWADGARYEGYWENGVYSGEGMYFFSNGMKHYGNFKNGVIDGLGVRYYLEKGLYFGEWKNGKNHGKGIYIWPNGEKFLGTFKDDQIEGVGVLSWLSGRKVEGIWADKGKGIGMTDHQKQEFEIQTPSNDYSIELNDHKSK